MTSESGKHAMTIGLAAGAAFCALLSACSDREPQANAAAPLTAAAAPASPSKAVAPPSLALDGDGLRLVARGGGSAGPLPFGTAQTAAIEAVSAALGRGPAERGANAECGAGPLRFAAWKSGPRLWFDGSGFVGWDNPGQLATMDGVATGVSRAAFSARQIEVQPNSSLGTEFTSGGLSGLLSSTAPDATVTALWAGETCIFR